MSVEVQSFLQTAKLKGVVIVMNMRYAQRGLVG